MILALLEKAIADPEQLRHITNWFSINSSRAKQCAYKSGSDNRQAERDGGDARRLTHARGPAGKVEWPLGSSSKGLLIATSAGPSAVVKRRHCMARRCQSNANTFTG